MPCPRERPPADWVLDVTSDDQPAFDTAIRKKKPGKKEKDGRGKRGGRDRTEHQHRKGEECAVESGPQRSRQPRTGLCGGSGKRSATTYSNASSSHKNRKEESNNGRPKASIGLKGKGDPRVKYWIRLLKAVAASLFVLAYSVGVAYVVAMFLRERSADQEKQGSNSAACAKVICPMNTICVIDEESRLPRCSSIGSSSAAMYELILAIVLGVPAAICLPCSLHWLYFYGYPRLQKMSLERAQRQRQALASSPDSPCTQHGDPPLSKFQRLLCRLVSWPAASWEQSAAPGGADASGSPADVPGHGAGPGGCSDEDMAELFAPVRRKKGNDAVLPGRGGREVSSKTNDQEEEDDLDLLFGSWRTTAKRAQPLPAGRSRGIEDGDVALDAIFSTAKRRPPGAAESTQPETAYDTGTKMPARRQGAGHARKPAPGRPASAASEVSEGLSCLFAVAGATKHRQPTCEPSSVASSGQYRSEDAEADGDAPEPLDFFAFALHISKRRGLTDPENDVAEDFSDVQSNTSDGAESLSSLEPAPLAELFHPPLVACY